MGENIVFPSQFVGALKAQSLFWRVFAPFPTKTGWWFEVWTIFCIRILGGMIQFDYTPEIQHSPWKMTLGRWVSFGDCLFLGAMLNFRGVIFFKMGWFNHQLEKCLFCHRSGDEQMLFCGHFLKGFSWTKKPLNPRTLVWFRYTNPTYGTY